MKRIYSQVTEEEFRSLYNEFANNFHEKVYVCPLEPMVTFSVKIVHSYVTFDILKRYDNGYYFFLTNWKECLKKEYQYLLESEYLTSLPDTVQEERF